MLYSDKIDWKSVSISVQIAEAKDLLLETNLLGIASKGNDLKPQCDVSIDNFVNFKSTGVTEGRNPTWGDKFKYGYQGIQPLARKMQLQVKVKEVNTFNRSDLGIAVLDIDSLIIKGDGEYDRWFELKKRKKMTKVSGAIHLVIVVNGTGLKSHSGSIESVDELIPYVDEGKEEEEEKNREPNTLVIKVLRGKEVEAMDMGGTSDPFIKFKIGLSIETTKVIFKRFPHDTFEWNEGPFKMRQHSPKDDTLIISLRDQDSLLGVKSWNLIGEATLKLSTLKGKGKITNWYSVERNGKIRGKVELEMEWVYIDAINDSLSSEAVNIAEGSDGEEPMESEETKLKLLEDSKKRAEEEAAMLKQLENTQIPSGKFQMRIHVIKAKGLAAKDLQGTSDPCVYISAFGQKVHSKVKKETLNPTFDDHLYVDFECNRDTLASEVIDVSVFDANTVVRNELIGSYVFDANWLYFQPGHEVYKQWVGISDNSKGNDNKIKGYLQISISLLGPNDVPVSHTDDKVAEVFDNRTNVLMPAAVGKEVKFLVVGAHKAENLPDMDSKLENGGIFGQGGIDAYVEVVQGKNKPLKTKYKTMKGDGKTKELSPVWNEELWVPVVEPSLSKAVQISVKDYDKMSSDDTVSVLQFNIDVIKKFPHGPRWFNLYGGPTCINSGEVYESMNKDPSTGSAWRGRALLSMKVIDKPIVRPGELPEPEIVHKKRGKWISEDHMPKTCFYNVRVNVILGCDIPFLKVALLIQEKVGVSVTCGSFSDATEFRPNKDGIVEWLKTLKIKARYPVDVTQVPDVFIYLNRESNNNPICYARFKMIDLIKPENAQKLQWIKMNEDESINALADKVSPGFVLARIDAHADAPQPSKTSSSASSTSTPVPVPTASSNIVTKPTAPEVSSPTSNEHSPSKTVSPSTISSKSQTALSAMPNDAEQYRMKNKFVVRVHIYQGRELPAADSNGLLDPFITVRFNGQTQKTAIHYKNQNPTFYQTLTFESELSNNFRFAPLIIMQVKDVDTVLGITSEEYVGQFHYDLSSSETFFNSDSSKMPDPKWYNIYYRNPGDSLGKILASCEIIPVLSVGMTIPPSPSLIPEYKKYFVEALILGVRELSPYELTNISYCNLTIDHGNELELSKVFSTANSKIPDGPNANFLSRLVIPVDVPINPLYVQPLRLTVRDSRMGGFRKPIVAVGTVDLGSLLKKMLTKNLRKASKTSINSTTSTDDVASVGNKNIDDHDVDLSDSDEEWAFEHAAVIADDDLIEKKEVDKEDDEEEKLDDRKSFTEIIDKDSTIVDPNSPSVKISTTPSESKDASNIQITQNPLGIPEDEEKKGKPKISFKTAGKITGKITVAEMKAADKGKTSPTNMLKLSGSRIGGKYSSEGGSSIIHKIKAIANDAKSSKIINATPKKSSILSTTSKDSNTLVEEAEEKEDDELLKEEIPPYLKNREEIGTELETALGKRPFDTTTLYRGKAALSLSKKSTFKKAGTLKANFRILNDENEPPLIDTKHFFKPKYYQVRVYVLSAEDLTPKDSNGKADPYLKVKLGKTVYHDLHDGPNPKHKKYGHCNATLNPDFHRYYEFNTNLPGASQLEIEVYDYDMIGYDEFIGKTTIDLDERIFNKKWKDLGIDEANTETKSLRKIPSEWRKLWSPSSTLPQGRIHLWVEILDENESRDYPPINISLPPPQKLEVRVVVWKCTDVPNQDIEGTSDIFFRGWIGEGKHQDTDTHWRITNGTGNFNWRWKFTVEYPGEFPELHFQAWDKDILKPYNDLICDDVIDISGALRRAHTKNEIFNPYLLKNRSKPPAEAPLAKKTDDDKEMDAMKHNFYNYLGLGMPEDGFWTPMYRTNEEKGEKEYQGKVLMSLEVVPEKLIADYPAGVGRSEPNVNPTLKEPAGRMHFSLNPFKTFGALCGPSLARKCFCLIFVALFIVCGAVLGPYIPIFTTILTNLNLPIVYIPASIVALCCLSFCLWNFKCCRCSCCRKKVKGDEEENQGLLPKEKKRKLSDPPSIKQEIVQVPTTTTGIEMKDLPSNKSTSISSNDSSVTSKEDDNVVKNRNKSKGGYDNLV